MTTTFTYDSAGNLLSRSTPSSWSTQTVYYAYSYAYGDSAHPGDVTAVTDPLGRKSTYTYDAAGNRTAAADPLGNSTSYTFDAIGRTLTTKTPLGKTTTYAYDADSRVLTVKDPLGNTATYGYDATGLRTTATDALSHTTTTAYDPNGHPTKVTYPDGTAATTAYDADGNTTSTTDQAGHTTNYAYDPLNRITSATDPLNRATSYTYDADGHLTVVTDPSGRTTTNTYDPVGNKTGTTHSDGASHATNLTTLRGAPAYSAAKIGNGTSSGTLGKLTTAAWNSTVGTAEAWVKTTSSSGTKVAVGSDGDGAGSHSIWIGQNNQYAAFGANDGSGTHTSTVAINDGAWHHLALTVDNAYEWDLYVDGTQALTYASAAGFLWNSTSSNIASTTDVAIGGLGNVPGYDWTGTVDEARISNVVRYYSYGFTPETSAFAVDSNTTALYHLDADGTDSVTTASGTYTYTADNQLETMSDASGTTTNTYDTLGLLADQTNGNNQITNYSRDRAEQLTAIVYPNDQTIFRGYDNAGRLTSITDWANNTTTFTPDADGNITNTAYGNGVTASATFDADGNLSGITDTGPGNTALASFGYTRNAVGNLTGATTAGITAPNQTYAYTTRDQLGGVNTSTYTYDPAGNPTALANGATLSYNAASERTTYTLGVATTNLAYDSQGNRTSGPGPNGTAANYVWDQANGLTNANGATATYTADGLRATRSPVGGASQQYFWDSHGAVPLMLTDGNTSYLYDDAGNPVEQIDAVGNTLYYQHDQYGSTRLLTNATGAVAATYTYDAYGNLTTKTGTADTVLRWNAQIQDADTGLYYLRARYYDPQTAQFISIDPMATATRAIYNYASENPLNMADPTGEITIGFCISGSGGGLSLGFIGQVCAVDAINDVDGSWQVGFTETKGLVDTVGGSVGVGASVQVSNARTVDQLGGPFFSGGGSASTKRGWNAGLSGFAGPSCGAPGDLAFGGEFTAGLGSGDSWELYAGKTDTWKQTSAVFKPWSLETYVQ